MNVNDVYHLNSLMHRSNCKVKITDCSLSKSKSCETSYVGRFSLDAYSHYIHTYACIYIYKYKRKNVYFARLRSLVIPTECFSPIVTNAMFVIAFLFDMYF